MSFIGSSNLVKLLLKVEIEPWQKWFAWRPVVLNGDRVWLKTIYRRRIWNYGSDNGQWPTWQYGTIFDVLTHSQ